MSSDLVAAHLTTGRPVASLRRQGIRRLAGQSVPALAVLDGRAALFDHRTMVYHLGFVAVADLVQRHGFASFGRLFMAMGNGQPFEPAFRAVFGETLTDFEARIDREFQSGRPSVGAAPATPSAASPFPQPSAAQAQAIRCIQTELARLGFDPGAVDGVIGPRTQDAFAEFRRAHPTRGSSLTPLSAPRWCDRIAAVGR